MVSPKDAFRPLLDEAGVAKEDIDRALSVIDVLTPWAPSRSEFEDRLRRGGTPEYHLTRWSDGKYKISSIEKAWRQYSGAD